ncbi:lysophospholipase [Pontiella sp.]|uniref:alpha/beta hydrolase n=1 Tax=Pontiella sp. TaxID=2837462 RepID=UPI003565F303
MSGSFEITAVDGLSLRGREWPADPANAVVGLVHGLGEHCARYDHVAAAFNARGYAVVALDLRGHGCSGGPRGHARNFDLLMADVSGLLEKAGELYPERPRILYGHSLGGSIAIRYALQRRSKLDALIATSPLLRLARNPPGWKSGLLKLLNALGIQGGIPSGLDDKALARDINVVRTYRNDPLTHDRISPAMAVGMIRAGEWNIEHAAQLACPLLLMHGDADRITSPEASKIFAGRAGANCTLNLWKGGFHELHNEPEKREVLGYMLDWLENCLQNPHSTGEST